MGGGETGHSVAASSPAWSTMTGGSVTETRTPERVAVTLTPACSLHNLWLKVTDIFCIILLTVLFLPLFLAHP